MAGWGGKSKHHIIFAFIFYGTKLCFVYNVNFVAFQSLSHSQLFVTPWTVARQAPLSIGFSKQEYWSELPFPPPGDLPNPGIDPESPVSSALAGGFFTTEPPEKFPLALEGKVLTTGWPAKSLAYLILMKRCGSLLDSKVWVASRRVEEGLSRSFSG